MAHDRAHELLVLSGADVRRLLTTTQCIELIDHAMRAVSLGKAQLPLRIGALIPGGNILATMPGFLEQPLATGAKVIAVYPDNHARGLPSHQGVVVLFDVMSGTPVAIVDATAITALRTAAASAVATRALARRDATRLAIIGTGEQAVEHLRAIAQVRALRSIRVWGRTEAHAARVAKEEAAGVNLDIAVAKTIEDAVADADIVCTTTSARESILSGRWIKAGTHVNLVGASSLQAREADANLIARSSLFVDYRGSALAQAAELRTGKEEADAALIRGEIGEVLEGKIPGRRADDEITVYKSLGIAAQDLAAAQFVFTRARETGQGARAAL